jgi:hypothetical protein
MGDEFGRPPGVALGMDMGVKGENVVIAEAVPAPGKAGAAHHPEGQLLLAAAPLNHL